MTDFNTIRVIPFCGKGDEWPILSDVFLAKTRRYEFKNILLGKLPIPKEDYKYDEVLDIEKRW
jgi:hypothetical protein